MSAKRAKGGPDDDDPDPVDTPDKYPVPPPRGPQVDDHWTMDHVMELQKTCSRLTETVTTLTARVGDQGTKLDAVSDDVRSAKAGLKVIWWIAGLTGTFVLFLIVRLWGPLMTLVARVAKAAAH